MKRSAARKNAEPARIWHFLEPVLRGRRARLLVIGLCSLGNGLAEAAILVLIARTSFALTKTGGRVEAQLGPFGSLELSVPLMLGIAAAAVGVKLVLQVVIALQTAAAASSVTADRRRTLTTLFLRASWDLQSKERHGHLQELTTTYVSQSTLALLAVVNLGVNVLNLLGLLGSAFVLSPIASLSAAGVVATLAIALRPLRAATRRRSERTAKANLAYATAATEMTSQAQEIRTSNVGDAVARRLDRDITAHARQQYRTMVVSRIVPGIYQSSALFLVVAALGVVYALGSTRLAALGAIVLILLRSLSFGQGAQTSYQNLQESAPYVARIHSEEERYLAAGVRTGGAPVKRVDEIAFRDVEFEYEPGRPVLRDVSFTARRGEVIGIIGPSGSGKSTLVQLLLRLREPCAGGVFGDGRDLASLALSDWYDRVAFVPQEAHLLTGTVAENIRFFRDVDQSEVQRAAELAQIHTDIESWKASYDTPVGERGNALSGGQRQRLCIARGLVGNPDVLVLDEPTSALDLISESLIREALAELGSRMLIVIIAHRLSTLDICDRLMVLQDGEVRGFDEPRQLEVTNAFYQEALRLSGLK